MAGPLTLDTPAVRAAQRVPPRVTLIDPASAPLVARDLFGSGNPGPIVASLAQVPELLSPTVRTGAALVHVLTTCLAEREGQHREQPGLP